MHPETHSSCRVGFTPTCPGYPLRKERSPGPRCASCTAQLGQQALISCTCACIWNRTVLGREGRAVMAMPMTLPLFLPGQIKGGGLWQEQTSVPAEKVRLWGRAQLTGELLFTGGWVEKLVPRLSSAGCEAENLFGMIGDCDP